MSETNEPQGMPEMPDQLPQEVVQTWLDQADEMRAHEWVRVRGRDIGAVMDEFREMLDGEREITDRRDEDAGYINALENRVRELRDSLRFVRRTREKAMAEVMRLQGILHKNGIAAGRPEDLHPDENQG